MIEAIAVSPTESAVSTMTRTGASTPISPEAVRGQLERILNSKAFARSPRISRFLSFVVEQTIDGQENKLKEYLLGVEVFGRMDSFDPRIDSIVRVEARRLRYKLEKYYETEGVSDSVHIQFRKGCYVPSFREKKPGNGEDDTGELSEVPYSRTIANPQTFALYVRGRAALGRWTEEGINEAISCFGHAAQEDPECAEAHAGLASAWMFAALSGRMPATDVVPKARAEAQRALALKPDCSEAHSILGAAAALYDREPAPGEQRLRRAVITNPCDIPARLWYGVFLAMAGRAEEGVREARKAQHAAPTSIAAHLVAGFNNHAAGAHDDALTHYRMAQDLAPNTYVPYLAAGMLFADQDMNEQAIHMLNRASQLDPHNPTVQAALAYGYSKAGRTEDAAKIASELDRNGASGYVCPVAAAMASSAAGNMDAAFRNIERAIDERSPWIALLRTAPSFEAVRQDSRFEQVSARLNGE